MDNKYFNIAKSLASRNTGKTGENPSVGAVIVKDNEIIGYGTTDIGGRPHAEVKAIEMAGKNAKGADIYVTLTPCTTEGKSGACSDKIAKADIKNIYVLEQDETQIQAPGTRHQAPVRAEGNKGFLTRIRKQRPFITVKIATSLDGKIALSNGKSKWITGEIARAYAHKLRAKNDAILVGSGTWTKDKPSLDCRLNGLEGFSPKIYIVSRSSAEALAKADGTLQGNNILSAQNMQENMQILARQGINNVLVEGGGKIIASLIKENLIDRLIWIKAPIILGGDGLPAVADLDITKMENKINLNLTRQHMLGEDTLEIYE